MSQTLAQIPLRRLSDKVRNKVHRESDFPHVLSQTEFTRAI